MTRSSRTLRGGAVGPAVVLAGFITIASGVGYRIVAAQLDTALNTAVTPARPLATLPLRIGHWHGTDVALEPGIRQIPGFDDEHVNRQYEHAGTGRTATVFVGFTGRPRTRLGHRPDVCYAAHGWHQDAEEPIVLRVAPGRKIPAVVYDFSSPGLSHGKRVVLAVYLVNGAYRSDPEAYSRRAFHDPLVTESGAPYVARLQVSVPASGNRFADLDLLCDLTGRIAEALADLMPYWRG